MIVSIQKGLKARLDPHFVLWQIQHTQFLVAKSHQSWIHVPSFWINTENQQLFGNSRCIIVVKYVGEISQSFPIYALSSPNFNIQKTSPALHCGPSGGGSVGAAIRQCFGACRSVKHAGRPAGCIGCISLQLASAEPPLRSPGALLGGLSLVDLT